VSFASKRQRATAPVDIAHASIKSNGGAVVPRTHNQRRQSRLHEKGNLLGGHISRKSSLPVNEVRGGRAWPPIQFELISGANTLTWFTSPNSSRPAHGPHPRKLLHETPLPIVLTAGRSKTFGFRGRVDGVMVVRGKVPNVTHHGNRVPSATRGFADGRYMIPKK
jgi:hypothetical protein